MSAQPTRGQIKALFHSLVGVCGGIEAAGSVLGVSIERVSQLQRPTHDDVPTILQIVALEMFAGQPVVTGALAKLVTGDTGVSDLLTEACELAEAAAGFQAIVRRGESPKAIRAAAMRVMQEVADLPNALPRD